MTKKRLEIAKLTGRVHVGEQAFHAAESLDLAFLHHPHLIEQTQPCRATRSRTARPGRVTPARVRRAQRMIAAFGLRYDGIAPGRSPILPPG